MRLSRAYDDSMRHHRIPSLAGVHACIEISEPNKGHVFLNVADGDVTLSREGKPDCTITGMVEGDLLRLVRGELNLVTSLLQGRIAIEGDVMLAIQLAGSLPEVGGVADLGDAR